VKPKNRLCQTEDIKRVRNNGRSYTHPLLVLIKEENSLDLLRIAVIAGKSTGSAVNRNRIKRRIRASVDGNLPTMKNGWDVILQARQGAQEAGFQQINEALKGLLIKAELLQINE
jgi:ribonuclease P protein component